MKGYLKALFPATAGILTTIIFFGALTGFFVPAQVEAVTECKCWARFRQYM